MAEAKATTIRFSEPMYSRLEQAGELTGLPINSIVVIACLEWLDAHEPMPPPGIANLAAGMMPSLAQGATLMPPRGRFPWARLSGVQWPHVKYPFDRFTRRAKRVLLLAQDEAGASGRDYIGDEDLLMGLFLEAEGVAGQLLRDLAVQEAPLRLAISQAAGERKGGPMERFGITTSRVKRIIDAAFKDAQGRGQKLVGTNNLLQGLLSEPDILAVAALQRAGVTRQTMEERLSQASTSDSD
jgi:hypothetical protein